MVSSDADNGGVGAAILKMGVPGVQVRSVTTESNYLDYPPDLQYPQDRDEILQLASEADVIHLRRNAAQALNVLEGRSNPKARLVAHHHGTEFRQDPAAALNWARTYGAKVAVATLDLAYQAEQLGAEVTWLPCPIPIAEYADMRKDLYEPSDVVRIFHAPTSRQAKDTALWVKANENLENIRALLMERRPHEECLREKARFADVLYDQLKWGWGINSLEAMAMGVPCIGGFSSPEIAAYVQRIVGLAPAVLVTPERLQRVLKALVEVSSHRKTVARTGKRYVERYHSFPAVREVLMSLWG